MTLMVSTRVENSVPQGQILKSKELHRVLPQMKALDEHFFDQLKCWRYYVIWWRNDVKIFLKDTKCTCSPPESMHARIRGPESMHARMGNLSQCMPECGEGFCKILLALWAIWFIYLFAFPAKLNCPDQTGLLSIWLKRCHCFLCE
jgi:hypothetical protein